MARPEGGYFRDGVRVNSVTEVLSLTRMRRWSGKPESWARRATIGSAVHNATAVLDVNACTWATAPRDWIEPFDAVDREVAGFVAAWEYFKRNEDFKPKLIEHSLFAYDGPTLFATTVDRVGLLRGRPAIVEIKTPKVKEPYWGVQLAGQELALMKSEGPPIERPHKYERWVAQLFSNGKYKLWLYDDPVEIQIFRYSLQIAVWNLNVYGA